MRRPRTTGAAGVGLVVGLLLAVASGAGVAAWRAPVVGAAAGLVIVALLDLGALGRAELQRRPVPGRAYRTPVLTLLTALVLAAVATA